MYTKGQIIVCPGCDDYIAMIVRDLVFGERLSEQMFSFFPNQTHNYMDRMNCKKCGAVSLFKTKS